MNITTGCSVFHFSAWVLSFGLAKESDSDHESMRKREGVYLCRMLRQGVGSGADEMPASHIPELFWGSV
jgi:hypothetical protein